MLKSWKFWLSLLIFALFIFIVEQSYGLAAILASWQAITPSSLLIAVLLMLASYLLRAARFYDFFHRYCQGHWWQLTRITVIHNFLNNLLPMRSGEVSFPLLMKQHFDCPARHSAPALLWLRLLDLYALLALSLWTLSGPMQQLFGWSSSAVWALQILVLLCPLMVLPLQNLIRRWLQEHRSGKLNKLADLMTALPDSPWPFLRPRDAGHSCGQ